MPDPYDVIIFGCESYHSKFDGEAARKWAYVYLIHTLVAYINMKLCVSIYDHVPVINSFCQQDNHTVYSLINRLPPTLLHTATLMHFNNLLKTSLVETLDHSELFINFELRLKHPSSNHHVNVLHLPC